MGYVLDNSYQVVKTIQAPYGTDLHEFSLVDGGKNALLTGYSPMPYDLTSFGVTDGLGWIEDSSFRNVDVSTGKMNF
jgi:hypothetical protein